MEGSAREGEDGFAVSGDGVGGTVGLEVTVDVVMGIGGMECC